MQIRALDLTDDATAAAVHRIGRAAYTVEAGLIGFDGIPALGESLAEMRGRALHWLGAFSGDGTLDGFLAWEEEAAVVSIDRLCVDPGRFRRGSARCCCAMSWWRCSPDGPSRSRPAPPTLPR